MVTSKAELADQLQKRVAGIEERVRQLTDDKTEAEEACTKEQYGVSNDTETKERLAEVHYIITSHGIT